MKYRILLETDEAGWIVATCPSLPGCIAQGRTRAETLANMNDAIAGYIEVLRKHGDPVPLPITEELLEVAV